MKKQKTESIIRLYNAIFGKKLEKFMADEVPVNITDEDLDKIYQALGTLSEREQKVLGMRFGYENEDGRPRVRERIGKEFNVTGERIRQIESGALRKLRKLAYRGRLSRIFQSEIVEKDIDKLFREIRELHRREAELKNELCDLERLPFNESENVRGKLATVDDLELSGDAPFFLEKAGIFTIADICCLKERELRRISGIRMKVDGIKKKLAEKGFSLSE